VKFLVPQELTLSQLANILRNRLHLTPSQVRSFTPLSQNSVLIAAVHLKVGAIYTAKSKLSGVVDNRC
jgi:hypothetical protein